MVYEASKDPEQLLRQAGFTKAPDRGWEIVLKENFRHRPGKIAIPSQRFHALVYGSRIEIHLDNQKRTFSHRATSYHEMIKPLIAKLKELDNLLN